MDEQFENDCNKLFYFLPSKIRKSVSRISSDFISETGLKEYYFPVLQAIFYKDGITQKEITSYLPFDKSRISVITNELISVGLITDSSEGRSSCLHLTDDGRKAFAVGRMYSKIAYNVLFEGFSEEELRHFYDFFVKLDKRLDSLLSDNQE